ncbi:hypothetical protein BDZ94DRAFT_1252111, partial [Collybia nuda]
MCYLKGNFIFVLIDMFYFLCIWYILDTDVHPLQNVTPEQLKEDDLQGYGGYSCQV